MENSSYPGLWYFPGHVWGVHTEYPWQQFPASKCLWICMEPLTKHPRESLSGQSNRKTLQYQCFPLNRIDQFENACAVNVHSLLLMLWKRLGFILRDVDVYMFRAFFIWIDRSYLWRSFTTMGNVWRLSSEWVRFFGRWTNGAVLDVCVVFLQ